MRRRAIRWGLTLLAAICFWPLGPSEHQNALVPRIPIPNAPVASLWLGPEPPSSDRGYGVRGFLSPSCRVRYRGWSGSGTVVYFDRHTGEGIILSCGHLFAPSGSGCDLDCELLFSYHNNARLKEPAIYPGNVIFYRMNGAEDLSLICFRPDWEPGYPAIGGVGSTLRPGRVLHSIGCDLAEEVGSYTVQFVGQGRAGYVSQFNGPRPGRSGGGLFTEDHTLVGICTGRNEWGGRGIGFFTPLDVIRCALTEEGFGWLLRVPPISASESVGSVVHKAPEPAH